MKEEEQAKAAEPEKPSLVEALATFNIIKKFKPLLETSHYIDPATKLITQKQMGIDWTRNWLFVNPDPNLHCNILQAIHTHCSFIPRRCLDCWKVVVKLPTVAALYKLWQWQLEFTKDFMGKDRFCKCGIEERQWVHYQYGGYFYNRGRTMGEMRHAQVLEGMQGLFGKDRATDEPGAVTRGLVEVILKRHCTEFELYNGPSSQYERTEAHEIMEKKIWAAWEKPQKNVGQPDYVVENVLEEWFRFAWDRGDQTVIAFNGGKPLWPATETYHNQPEKGVKTP